MIKTALFSLFISFSAMANVPTVESLFRHGSNPDVTANGVSLNLKVEKVLLNLEKPEGLMHDVSGKNNRTSDFFKVFFTKTPTDVFKVAQARYSKSNFSITSVEHKVYYSNFTSYSFKPNIESVEKGIFFGLLNSLVLNDGSFLVSYLKSLGVPVKLNKELINQEKIQYLSEYKRYLGVISKDRSAKKTEENPLRPNDPVLREKVEKTMNESMYIDTNQVKLARDEGDMIWAIDAEPFQATVSYKNRYVQKVTYKSEGREFEIHCKDYWTANGTHILPRFLIVKALSGESYRVELTNLRHYNEKEEDMLKRLKAWDEVLRGRDSVDPRPPFLL